MSDPIADDSLWVRLCYAVRALDEPAAKTLLRIERGELRAREDYDGIHVLAEDLLTLWRRQLEARRAAVIAATTESRRAS